MFMKRKFYLGTCKHSLSARSSVTRVASKPVCNGALALNISLFIVTSIGITCKYVLFAFWGMLVIWLLLTTAFVSTGDSDSGWSKES